MATSPLHLRYEGDGEFRAPTSFWAGRADREYVVGEVYPMAEHQDRSDASHNHEFAFVAEAWKNLPEQFKHEPWAQSAEHLRKYALIRCKFCNTQTFPCSSEAEAKRWAANIRPLDEYSLVTFEGSLVYRFTAMSQKRRGIGAMDKAAFQASKQAIMDFLDDLLDVERGATAENARRAA